MSLVRALLQHDVRLPWAELRTNQSRNSAKLMLMPNTYLHEHGNAIWIDECGMIPHPLDSNAGNIHHNNHDIKI